MDVNDVLDKWPRQFSDAIEFTMCHQGLDADAAEGHVLNNWVFDTQEHEGNTVLLARDEDANQSMAWMPNMGGWYMRLGGNSKKCPQSGKLKPKSLRGDGPKSKPEKSGTKVSGDRHGFLP